MYSYLAMNPSQTSTATCTTSDEVTANSSFSINQWFNKYPIRIIGTPEEPFFYATDLATILGIKNVKSSVRSFTEKDIVSLKQREQHSIITYRKYRDTMRPDPKIILLTERGAYKLVVNSRSIVAESFQDFIYDFIHDTRLAERQRLQTIHSNDMVTLATANTDLTNRLQLFETMIPIIYVFKKTIDGDPYDHIPVHEIDEYFREASDRICKREPVETLYKLSCRPTDLDFTYFALYAKIFGVVEHVFVEINTEDEIPITQKAAKYCKYFTEEPDLDDISGVKVEYQPTI
jgi:prophage antirepressor-like protein